MTYITTIQQEIPVAGEYDVVVYGGRPAGFIAAISAARAGCMTSLVERLPFFRQYYIFLHLNALHDLNSNLYLDAIVQNKKSGK